MAPAYVSAVYSPRESPAATLALLTASSPPSALSFSSAAMLATKMAGWLTAVLFSFSAGPSVQTCRRSYPRMSEACSKSSLALGTSAQTSFAMPTVWAPCPGKKNAVLGT